MTPPVTRSWKIERASARRPVVSSGPVVAVDPVQEDLEQPGADPILPDVVVSVAEHRYGGVAEIPAQGPPAGSAAPSRP